MFSRVLAPLDGSQAATEKLPEIAALCKFFGARLVLLTVIDNRQQDAMLVDLPTGSGTARGDMTDIEDLEGRVRIYLNRALIFLQRAGIKVIGMHKNGDADATILRAASEYECDLIALSPGTHQTSRRLLIGSVTERVMHSSEIPIFVARAGNGAVFSGNPDGGSNQSTILVPLDGSRDAEAPLGFASSLAAHMRAGLKLATVIPPALEPGEAGDLELAASRTDIGNYLTRLALLAAEEGTNVDIDVAHGDPASEFIKIAGKVSQPIVVISTRRHSAASRKIIGSFTDRIMRRMTNPMFAIPRDR